MSNESKDRLCLAGQDRVSTGIPAAKRALALSLVLLLVLGSILTALGNWPTTAAAASKEDPKAVLVRKNVKDLTPAEKHEIVAAIKKLKKLPSPYHPLCFASTSATEVLRAVRRSRSLLFQREEYTYGTLDI